jgi:hypothetical protein
MSSWMLRGIVLKSASFSPKHFYSSLSLQENLQGMQLATTVASLKCYQAAAHSLGLAARKRNLLP